MVVAEDQKSALDGIRVVEIGTGTVATIVGMLLGDFGADVLRVDPVACASTLPTSDVLRHRNKRRVVIEDSAADREELNRLLAAADVCVCGPQAGISAERRTAICAQNQELIWLDLPVWEGPAPWGDVESHGLLAAWCGMSARQASFSGEPVEPVYDLLFVAHGVWAATCLVACLVERESSGAGQMVTISGAHAMLIPLIGILAVDADKPDPTTAIGPFGRHPTYSIFECGDGLWLACGALGERFEDLILKILGLTHVLEDEHMAGGRDSISQPAVFTWMRERVVEAFRSRPRQHWMDELEEAGIPSGPVSDRDAWLDHPQVRALGEALEIEDSTHRKVTMPGIPVHLTRTPGLDPVLPRAATFADVDWKPKESAAPQASRLRPGPLAGTRVINTGTFVAGPYSGSLMAELGADVIKLEPTSGDQFRQTGFMYSRGMRSIALDLGTAEGKDVLHDLVEHVDVVMSSLRPGVANKLGLDHDSLALRRPGIITTGISGYGEQGPMSLSPGVDMVLQAVSGMMSTQGGADEPVVNTLAIIDFTTAAVTCLGATLGLFNLRRTGEGQHSWSSLADVATLLQGPALLRIDDEPVTFPIGGRDFKGDRPSDRLYPVRDGWVRLYAASADSMSADHLVGAGLAVDPEMHVADPCAAISSALADIDAREAVRRLRLAGVAAVRVRRVTEVLRDTDLIGHGRIEIRSGDNDECFTAPGRYATFGRTARSDAMRTPGAGEHTSEILADIYSGERVLELLEKRVVVQGQPMPQQLGAVYR